MGTFEAWRSLYEQYKFVVFGKCREKTWYRTGLCEKSGHLNDTALPDMEQESIATHQTIFILAFLICIWRGTGGSDALF